MPVLACESKAWLFRQSGAQAVDMESAAVAHVAAAENLPLFAMRAICDTAANTVPQILRNILDPANTFRWQGLVNTLLQTPVRVVDAVRLGKNFCLALSALRNGWRLQMKHRLIARFVFRKRPSADPAPTSSPNAQPNRQGLPM
jgi:adenosylhomocysteine nucleosidase